MLLLNWGGDFFFSLSFLDFFVLISRAQVWRVYVCRHTGV